MSLPKYYEPCPLEWMNHSNPRFTICEVLRSIYRETDDDNIKTLSRVAMNMAKRMNNKLMEYNATWQELYDGKTDDIKRRIGGQDGSN